MGLRSMLGYKSSFASGCLTGPLQRAEFILSAVEGLPFGVGL